MEQINIKEATIEQLKSFAFDQIRIGERCRANVSMVEQELILRERENKKDENLGLDKK